MSTVGTATNAAAANAASVLSTAAGPGVDAAQDRFLKLLVTQLKNQDPLNPMDNAEITTQMAQISTVSGIDKLNTTLQSMAASFSADQSLQATAMIGRNVLVPGSSLQLQDGAALGGLSLPQAADKVVVSISDGSGLLVRKLDLGAQPAGVLGYQWDGKTDGGADAQPGAYSFSVEAIQGGNKVDAIALSRGLVGGVTQGKDGVTLKLNGMGSVALPEVKQVM